MKTQTSFLKIEDLKNFRGSFFKTCKTIFIILLILKASKLVNCSSHVALQKPNNLYSVCNSHIQAKKCVKCLKKSLHYKSFPILTVIRCALVESKLNLDVFTEPWQKKRGNLEITNDRFEIIRFKQNEGNMIDVNDVYLFDYETKCLDILQIGFPHYDHFILAVNDRPAFKYDYGINNTSAQLQKYKLCEEFQKDKIVFFPVLRGFKFVVIAIPKTNEADDKSLYNRLKKDSKILDSDFVFDYKNVFYFISLKGKLIISKKDIEFKTILNAIEKQYENIGRFFDFLGLNVSSKKIIFHFTIIENEVSLENEDKIAFQHPDTNNPIKNGSFFGSSVLTHKNSDIVLYFVNEIDIEKSKDFNTSVLFKVHKDLSQVKKAIFFESTDFVNYLDNWHYFLNRSKDQYGQFILNYYVLKHKRLVEMSFDLNTLFLKIERVRSVNIYRLLKSKNNLTEMDIVINPLLQQHMERLEAVEDLFRFIFIGIELKSDIQLSEITFIIQKYKSEEFSLFMEALEMAFSGVNLSKAHELILMEFHQTIIQSIQILAQQMPTNTNQIDSDDDNNDGKKTHISNGVSIIVLESLFDTFLNRVYPFLEQY